MAQNTAQPDPSTSASSPSSPAWLRVAGWVGATLVCLAVFALYMQPEFLMTLADQLWSCF